MRYFPLILAIVFTIFKLTGLIAWSWVWVLSPLWITAVIWLVAFLIIGGAAISLTFRGKDKHW